MRFYRVRYTYEAGTSLGFEWFTNAYRAQVACRDFYSQRKDEDGSATIETVDIQPTKGGILTALKRYASHPDNG